MATYKWDSPIEWFEHYIHRISANALHSLAVDLASKLDSDVLQDMFQRDMDADGYFRDLDKLFPVLFVIHPTTAEAEGTVYHFCSDACRNAFDHGAEQVKAGDAKLTMDNVACDECGNELEY